MLNASLAAMAPVKPQAPEHGECCGNGCERCVYDLYDEALAQWQARQRATPDAADAP